MTPRLEHANLSVHDIDAIIRFLRAAFPEFQIRRDVTEPDGLRWVHLGTEDTYVTLNQAKREYHVTQRGSPLNHLAFEVADVEIVGTRLRNAGYQENTLVPNSHPYRKRLYFSDPEGNEWELVQYLSSDPAKRNDYTLPDK